MKEARHVIRLFLKVTGYRAITLPPMGIYALPDSLSDKRLEKHEQCHWAQYERMGAIKFYSTYLWLLVRHGYAEHPMEQEARRAESA